MIVSTSVALYSIISQVYIHLVEIVTECSGQKLFVQQMTVDNDDDKTGGC